MRHTHAIRQLTALPFPGPEKCIWPVFIGDAPAQKTPIPSLPDLYCYGVDTLSRALEPLCDHGIGGVLLFPVPPSHHKTPDAAHAYDDAGIVPAALRVLRTRFPALTFFTDVCLCAYTPHGHCAIHNDLRQRDEECTRATLAKIACAHANAGAHFVAPSAMADGQVAAIRTALDAAHLTDAGIMSYSSKFASAFYAPFRNAVDCAPQYGDRAAYQTAPDSPALALRESLNDEKEGADILMVKPALAYLDIIALIKQHSNLPLAAYNVSGEYLMLRSLAEATGTPLATLVRETFTAYSRAGADIIISYWTHRYAEFFITP
jgi:porphobilinogen synthase